MLLCRTVLLMDDEPRQPFVPTGEVEAYVAATLHAPVQLRPWGRAGELPPYLKAAYGFFEGCLHGAPVLWLFVEERRPTPAALRKHIAAVAPLWGETMVAVFRELPSYERQRLIQHGVSFVVPGTQLYLPDMGVDFRSRARAARRLYETVLRPSAQVVLLHLLEAVADTPFTAVELAKVLGYTKMTMARAVSELENAGFIKVRRTGRANEFQLAAPRREVWTAAQDRLLSPVARRVTVQATGEAVGPLAGLSALAAYTMLAAPAVPVRAVGLARAKELDEIRREQGADWMLLAREEDEQQLEVWSYDPRVLGDGPAVDRLSLYLSLRDDQDERVQQALEQLLEGVSW